MSTPPPIFLSVCQRATPDQLFRAMVEESKQIVPCCECRKPVFVRPEKYAMLFAPPKSGTVYWVCDECFKTLPDRIEAYRKGVKT